MTLRLSLAWLCVSVVFGAPSDADGGPKVDFKARIAPILEQRCLRCHSPGNNKGEISLATSEDLRKNEYVVAGDPDSSYLLELIQGADGQRPSMPKEGDALSAEQVTLIARWITEGAVWPEDVVVRNRSRAEIGRAHV